METTVAGCQADALGTLITVVPLFPRRVTIAVVPVHLPKPWLVVLHEAQAPYPLGGLPEIQVRHQEARRPPVFGLERLAVVLPDDQRLSFQQILHRQGVLDDVNVRVALRREWASHSPFLKPNLRTSFEPHRVAIETTDGRVVEERLQPRDSFVGHGVDTPWDRLQLAYFAGYAMWTYLTTPFLFAMDGVATEELEPWRENGETWRRLKVTFPHSIATHSTVQIVLFRLGRPTQAP